MAQHPVTIQLLEKDGLPSNEFYCLAEDAKGFIWLAGHKGITKYDGKKFTTLSHPEKKGLSLFGAKLDKKDRLWCINLYGQLFYIENDQLHLEADFNQELRGRLATFDILDNLIILSTHSIIIEYDLSTKKVTIKNIENIRSHTIPLTFGNKIYSGSNDTINQIDAAVRHSYKLKLISTNKKYLDDLERTIVTLTPLYNDLFLVSSHQLEKNNEFIVWNLKNGSEKILKLPDYLIDIRHIKHYYIDQKLWILTDNGIFITNIIDEEVVVEAHFFKGKRVSDLLVDRDNNYWITTTENGVYIIPNIHIKEIKLPQELESPTDIQLVEDQLFIGTTSNKLYKYDLSSQKGSTVDFKQTRPLKKIFYNPYRNDLLINHEANSFRYNLENENFVKLSYLSNIKDVVFLNENQILFATSSKISKFNLSNYRNLESLAHFKQNETLKQNGRGYSVFYDSLTSSEFYGNINGLYRSGPEKITDTIKTRDGQPIYAKDIAQTNNGKLWVSSFSNGVFKIENDYTATPLSELINFRSNRTEVIKEDGNILWITTSEGVYKYNTENNDLKELQKNDGILSYNINNIAVGDRSIYISSDEGVFEVDKMRAFKTKTPKKLLLENVQVNNDTIMDFTTLKMKESSFLKVDFIAPGFKFQESKSFQYRLLGLHENWTYLEPGSRSIQLASMPHGDFNLQIKSDKNSRLEDSIALPIHVTLPFYKSIWTWILFSFITIAFIVFYYKRLLRFRESEKNKQLKQLEVNAELVNLKLENLRSQMNPHFIFNALNSIQDYIIDNEKELASIYLSKFADLIRTYLNQSINGKISLKEEMDTLHKYLELEKLRFEDQLTFTINDNHMEDTDLIRIPAMLIQPYVENALQHGLMHQKNHRRLDIDFQLVENDILLCTVTDNGIGRAASKKIQTKKWRRHPSFATSATKNRLELLNFNVSKKAGVRMIDLYNEKNAAGTKVIIKIPFSTSY